MERYGRKIEREDGKAEKLPLYSIEPPRLSSLSKNK
jgi:hypothetical protein